MLGEIIQAKLMVNATLLDGVSNFFADYFLIFSVFNLSTMLILMLKSP